MNDPDALLAAVLADPTCDTTRLVYADAVQEAGDDARSEFIRGGIALVACGPPHAALSVIGSTDLTACAVTARGDGYYSVNIGEQELFPIGSRIDVYKNVPLGKPKWMRGMKVVAYRNGEVHFRRDADSGPWKGAAIKQREHDLLRSVLNDLCETLPGGGWDYFRHDNVTNAADLYQNGRVVFQPVTFTRGFLSAVSAVLPVGVPQNPPLPVDRFANAVAAIFSQHPLESVTVGFEGSERKWTAGIRRNETMWWIGWDDKPRLGMDWLAIDPRRHVKDARSELLAALPGWLTNALREPATAVAREQEAHA